MTRQSEIQQKYDAKNTKRYGLKLNMKTDAEIIERLDKADSTQGYIRELIRRDMEMDKGRFKTYSIIKISIEELNKEFAKPVANIDYDRVFDSTSIGAIIRKLDELKAKDTEYSIEEFIADEDGELVEGSDYDTPSNFRKRNQIHAA